ncbi:translational machinery component [Aulographum hederae CBS 113979]|uniref:Translational machinery component n=1 Tax=Aulographum hederae CBS 113979 TaxID=1176131 RepID=A0A6G1GVF9_9PEZI|nr:translational machinery component [Aulographum hederae CBS 113979]
MAKPLSRLQGRLPLGCNCPLTIPSRPVFARNLTTTSPARDMNIPRSSIPTSASANLARLREQRASGIDEIQKAHEEKGLSARPPYRMCVFSHKHNTHITLSRKNTKGSKSSTIMSFSTGNLGFRKGARGSYDAAFQLTSFVLAKISEGGYLPEIRRLELAMRGFGKGREAALKAILGAEGRMIKNKIERVTDATRLKFGGTRGMNPRRLG